MNAPRAASPVLLALLALVALPSTALADVVHLDSGGQYKGRIVKEDSRSITIETKAGGKVRVAKDEIARVVREEDFSATFKLKLADVKKSKNAKKWCELGDWAKSKQLEKKAKRCYEYALKYDADCEPARLALGHKLHEGEWYSADDYRRDVQGLVEHEGEWVTPEAKTNLEAGLVLRDGRWVLPEEEKPAPVRGARKDKATSVEASARKPERSPVKKEKKVKVRRGRGAKFKAMSFNIRYDFKGDGENRWEHRVEAVAKVIQMATVVGIQEDKMHQIDELRPLLPGYEIVGGGRNPTGRGERCSIMVKRSEAKIREWGEFWLSDTPDVKGSNTWNDRYPRKVTWALIDLKGARTPLMILNTHFPEKDKGVDPENRIKGARVMNEFLRDKIPAKERKKIAVLITGDYNSAPDEEPRQVLVGAGKTATGLRDSWHEAPHPAFGGTFNGFSGRQGNRRIDWMLVGGPVKVHRYDTFAEQVDGRWPSDHYPILTHLELR